MDLSDEPTLLVSQLLVGLAALPEQTNRRAATKLATGKGRCLIAGDDVEPVIAGWFRGDEPLDIFIELPYVRRSRRRDPLQEWIEGKQTESTWIDEFERFTEFLAGPVSTCLPWVLRGIEQLLPFLDSQLTSVDWPALGLYSETGTCSRLAASMVRHGAPATRLLANEVADQATAILDYEPVDLDLTEVSIRHALLGAIGDLSEDLEQDERQTLERLRRWIEGQARRGGDEGRAGL